MNAAPETTRPERGSRDDPFAQDLDLSGRTLAGHLVLEELGAGGMGKVYLAEDLGLRRKVALKVLPPEVASDAERLKRFKREAQALAALNHPNIVTIYRIHDVDDIVFFTMEHIAGRTLGKCIGKDGLPQEKLIDLAIPLVDAIHAAHQRSIIHRDLKPQNVMVTDEGRLKVLDFGLAKRQHGIVVDPQAPTQDLNAEPEMPVESALTQPGGVLGTYAYMSPEQIRGLPSDHRTDIFSLGIVLYEMATGRRPFHGSNYAALLLAILDKEPHFPPDRNDISERLRSVVLKCLEKDPNDRFPTAQALSRALDDLRVSTTAAAETAAAENTLRERRTTPSLWNVPYERNPFFTGREGLLQTLCDSLAQRQAGAMGQAISGLGGIGKTQMVVEYAWRFRRQYTAVFWVRAETVAQARSDFAEIARLLDLPESRGSDLGATVAAVRRWLGIHEGWLLLLDNADTPDLLSALLPRTPRGDVLLTSRAQTFGSLGILHPLRITSLETDAAVHFLLQRAGREENADEEECHAARELADELGRLPLALEQAAAYVAAKQARFASYLKSFRKRRLRLLEMGTPRTSEYPDSVATTWEASFREVEEDLPASAELLRFSAFLHPDGIPLDLLEHSGALLGPLLAEELEDAAEDPLILNDLLEPLTRFSLVQRDVTTDTYSVHRLVQAVVRSQIDPEEQREQARRAVAALAHCFPEEVEFVHWSLCERLLPHGRAVLALAQERHFEKLLESAEAASLMERLGIYTYRRGLYDEAEPLHLRALELRERLLGDKDPAVADSLLQLGKVHRTCSRYETAEPYILRALKIYEDAFGEKDPRIVPCLHLLALMLRDQGRWDEAEKVYARTLKLLEAAHGPEHPDVALCLNFLAALLRTRGRWRKAEKAYLRALSIREKTLGPDHPDVAMSLDSLAALYRDRRRWRDAEPLRKRALEIREKALGPDHPDVAFPLTGLAAIYRAQKRWSEAEPLYRRAVKIREKALGPDHPDVAYSLLSLAALYRDQGFFQEAEPLYRRSLEIREQSLGAEHPLVAQSLYSLGTLYRDHDKLDDAEVFFERSLGIREQALEASHPDVARSAYGLATIYSRQNRQDDACNLFERVLRLLDEAVEPDHPLRIGALERYRELLVAMEREEDAAKIAEQVHELRKS